VKVKLKIIATINSIQADMKAVLGQIKICSIIKEIETKFDVSDVKIKRRLEDKFLSYHFKIFQRLLL
jgi:hypothetical protein